ncbi:asparagine synthase (glutamine-hydrolyzing) [Mariniblastus sp.]|nr:asparagine synthase (glutamine-hydrolyzing) [Mariniblastus sp.]
MCGILGIITGPNGELLDESRVLRMRDTMEDRGPDGAGFFRHEQTTLAHRRLAIRDIEHGQQPWISQDGKFAFVYNGEIYNDDEITKSLSENGVQLRTQCDTEVLAEAWSLWGRECIDRIRGMFAFAAVELRTGRTWLVRDRVGMKPLFYAAIDGDFVFASSIAAIRMHPRFTSEPNLATLSHYLQTLRITLGRDTVFQGISTLLPGEIVSFQYPDLNSDFYWVPPTQATKPTLSFEDAASQLGESLKQTVRQHLKSDVTVGMMMSGGVDSNTLATLVRQQSGRKMTGVCGGGVNTPPTNEAGSDFEFARSCASHLDFDYSEVRITSEQYLDSWQALVGKLQSPLATPTDTIIFNIAKHLKQFCGVALGGEGADEAFCGYAIQHWSGHDFDRAQGMNQLNDPQQLEFQNGLNQQYGRHNFNSLAEHYLTSNGLVPWSAQKALFRPEYYSDEIPQLITSHYQQIFEAQGDIPTAEKYAGVLISVNLESLLRRLDTATMAASLEARVPFADHVIIENAVKLPHHYKIDLAPQETSPWLNSLALSERGSLRSKRILRSVASGLMPTPLAQRPKMSFPTPLPNWLSSDWQPWIKKKLEQSDFANTLFRPEALAEMANFPNELSLWKWPLINTILWGDQCFN